MSLEENFETYFKEKYVNEEREQNTETDNRFLRVFTERLAQTQRYNKYYTNLVFSVCTVSYLELN